MCATAIARETGQTIVDARKRIWLVDSEVRCDGQKPKLTTQPADKRVAVAVYLHAYMAYWR